MEEIFPWLYFYVYKSVNPSFTNNFWDSVFLIQQKKETWKSKHYCLNGFFPQRLFFLLRIYHQQFQRTSLLMVLDFLAKHTPFSRPLLSILNNLHFTKQGPLKSHNSGLLLLVHFCWKMSQSFEETCDDLWNIPRDTKVTVFGTATSQTTGWNFY